MSAISQSRICNRALTLIGAERITTITDNSEPARQCLALYDETLEDILSEHPWTFAQKRVELATVDETPAFTEDGMTVVYQKPSDLIKINFVNIEGAVFKIEGERILSDTSGLKIKYTYLNTNPPSYFRKFVIAFATLLAAELAYPITHSRTNADNLYSLYYDKLLPDAMALDSQQGTPTAPEQDEWLLSRIAGGSASFTGQTGADTWYPIGTM